MTKPKIKKQLTGPKPKGPTAAARRQRPGVALTLAQNLMDHRNKARMGQRTLAELAGIGHNTLAAMEKAQRDPSLSCVEAVAKALDLPTWMLVKP